MPIMMATIKQNENKYSGCEEMRISVPCWKECKTVLLWETAWQVLRKSNIELPQDPAIPFLGTESRDSERYLWTKFMAALLTITEKVEITQMSIDLWVDKQSVAHTHTHDGKWWNSSAGSNVAKSWRRSATYNKPDVKGWIWHDSAFIRYLHT